MANQYADGNGDEKNCTAPVAPCGKSGPVIDDSTGVGGCVPGEPQAEQFIPNPAQP